MSEIGHNGQLRAIVERIEKLDNEIKGLRDDQKDIYAEAKSGGYDVKALRAAIKRRSVDAQKLAEHEAQVELYMAALESLVRP
jgi:uncharacterized protein (UPF0335 family)